MMKNDSKIYILVIENNDLLRNGIAAMLKDHSEFEIHLRSADRDFEYQLKSMDLHIDIIVLNLNLGKVDCAKLITFLKEEHPATKIIAMDCIPDHIDIIKFMKSGGSGIILRNAPVNVWVKTIRLVAEGTKVLPPTLIQQLLTEIEELATKNCYGLPADMDRFTLRERQVVNLIAEGLSNKEIADALHIATFTVKNHVHNILEKSEFNTRIQVANFVNKNGFV